jgi:phage portal protein BeeE
MGLLLPARTPDTATAMRSMRALAASGRGREFFNTLPDLADPFAGTAMARDTSVAWMTFMGIPQEGSGINTYDRLADFSRAPADMGWVMACVQRLANAASTTPLRVYVKHGRELVDWEDEPTPAAEDYQYLLDTVNPIDMTGAEMRAYIVASRKVWGGWYLKKVQGAKFHDTQELYWLRVPDVAPHSNDGRAIDWYDFRPTRPGSLTQAEQYKPDQIIRHRGLNLSSNIDMLSPLSAARYDLVTDEAAAMRTASILRRRGVPEGYWSAKQGSELGPQDKSAIRRFLRQLVGPRNAGKALVAPDIEFHAIDLPEKDAQWLAGRKVSRMMVSAIMGVPMVLAGDDEHAGVYRSVRDAEWVMWRDTVIPEQDADADTFNNWLTPEFNRPGDPKLTVAYDYSKVEALKPVWKDEWAAWIAGISAQVITPNRFIDHFRLGEHVPWGDKPVPRTTIAVKGDTPGVMDELPTMIDADVAPSDAPDDGADDGTGSQVDRAAAGRRGGAIGEAIRKAADAKPSDVVEAVVGALRKQWPEAQLDIVREGDWTFDPAMKLSKIDYARRPVARNPDKVAGVEAELKVGAPIAPATIIKTPDGYTPIDGWHRLLGADHAGLKKVPVYIGEGDADWTAQLLKFNDSIPTPSDSPQGGGK